MGQFNSGVWISGLLIYFFTFFLIVFSFVNAANSVGLDTSGIQFDDPGFIRGDPLTNNVGTCTGVLSGACSEIPFPSSDQCETASLFCSFSQQNDICTGFHFVTDCSNPPGPGTLNISQCTAIGCIFVTEDVIDSIDPNKQASIGSIKNTLALMTGFSAEIGLPGSIRFIYSFFMFWLPFFMLLFSMYMALPYIH